MYTCSNYESIRTQISTKVFEMVDEVRKFSSLVDFVTGRHYTFCQRPRATTEYTNFTNLKIIKLNN